jgi:hypothetical protein
MAGFLFRELLPELAPGMRETAVLPDRDAIRSRVSEGLAEARNGGGDLGILFGLVDMPGRAELLRQLTPMELRQLRLTPVAYAEMALASAVPAEEMALFLQREGMTPETLQEYVELKRQPRVVTRLPAGDVRARLLNSILKHDIVIQAALDNTLNAVDRVQAFRVLEETEGLDDALRRAPALIPALVEMAVRGSPADLQSIAEGALEDVTDPRLRALIEERYLMLDASLLGKADSAERLGTVLAGSDSPEALRRTTALIEMRNKDWPPVPVNASAAQTLGAQARTVPDATLRPELLARLIPEGTETGPELAHLLLGEETRLRAAGDEPGAQRARSCLKAMPRVLPFLPQVAQRTQDPVLREAATRP